MWRRGGVMASAAAVVALSIAGCGLRLPAVTGAQRSAAAQAGTGSRTGTDSWTSTRPLATTVVRPDARAAVGASAAGARGDSTVRAFADTYINWNAHDFATLLERLARASTGQAQATMVLDAAEVAHDSSLRADGIANSGTVEAVVRLDGGDGDQYVVVTREQTSSTKTSAYTGGGPSWHVTLATVVRVGGRWLVSEWQPQS